MRTLMMLCLVLLTGSGCHTSMMNDPGAMRDLVDQARAENDTHLAAVGEALSLAAVATETARHDGRMEQIMGDMDDTMAGMSHCTGAGMADMHGMMTGMTTEMDGHHTAMQDADDLAAARAEADRHAAAMTGMMDGMDGAMGHAGCGM